MSIRSDRGGFALPMAILLIALITASAVAAFTRTGVEAIAGYNQSSETAAFALAEAGLHQYLAIGRPTPATVTYTYAAGTATITTVQVRSTAVTTDTAVYLVSSTGTVTAIPGRPTSTRTVAQFASYAPASMSVRSSWTSLSGLRKDGSSGAIMGDDACSDAVLAGVAVPTGEYDGFTSPVSGSPAIDYAGTESAMAASINIDWVNIASATPSITADVIYCRSGTNGYISGMTPCGTFPTTTAFAAAPDYWPTIIINGSSALPSSGRGMLIVTGDLDLNGGDTWEGVILVGGIITDNGNGDISGAVVTGLNIKKGIAVEESSLAHGTKTYRYDSCDVASAVSGLRRLVSMTNTWMDNWSTW
jgi:hypothetical protein